MKKSIPKPLNWQDFESLCKFLWGELWGIPDKIKKNGRLGQAQAGVDIYGIPNGKNRYAGIQCKGKDAYSHAKLTEKEINDEISNARMFSPALETLIFATTANKDSLMEQYIREKDIENRNNNSFEILIFYWEDIADLVEANRNTFNYYISDNQFRTKYELDVTFLNGSRISTIHPKFKKQVKVYKIISGDSGTYSKAAYPTIENAPISVFKSPLSTIVNHSWIPFEIRFENTGSLVLEDFKLYIYPEENAFREISGYCGGITERISYFTNSPLYVYEDEKYAVFRHKDNSPLIQKESRSFTIYILTKQVEYEMKIEYELLARDFSLQGQLILKVEPEYELEEHVIYISDEEEICKDQCTIEDIVSQGSFL